MIKIINKKRFSFKIYYGGFALFGECCIKIGYINDKDEDNNLYLRYIRIYQNWENERWK
jgi:hypothetical protein